MVAKIKDEIRGHEELVDAAIRLHSEIQSLESQILEKKVQLRDIASKTIGIKETSIMLNGTAGKIKVTFNLKQYLKFLQGKTEADLPKNLKSIFMEKISEYAFVKNAEELVEKHPDILQYVSLNFKTASVSIPEVVVK